jgi:hypothetical protein
MKSKKMSGGLAQMVEHLASKGKTLSSKPSTSKKFLFHQIFPTGYPHYHEFL